MAKLTALQLVNNVLENNSLSAITNLLLMDKIEKFAFDALNKHILDIGMERLWRPLESIDEVSIVLTESVRKYQIPDDMYEIDKKSFRLNNSSHIEFLTQQEFDRRFVDQNASNGTPTHITIEGDYFSLNCPASAALAGKIISFRKWVIPDLLNTSYPSQTSWFPQGFDISVLVAIATFDVMVFREDPEASVYWNRVYGDSQKKQEGAKSKMLRRFTSKRDSEIPVLGVL